MNKFQEIRPVVLGLATRDNKLLVGEGFDNVSKQTFYRCLGGGIEFLERSEDALKREFQEELNANITIKDFLGIAENIFTYNGKDAHELVLFYSIDIPESYYKQEYNVNEGDTSYKAMWIDISNFKNGEKILYPKEVFRYL